MYVEMRRYCPGDSKMYHLCIYVELVKSGLDMTESCGCKMGMDIFKLVWVFVGGHSNNLVRP